MRITLYKFAKPCNNTVLTQKVYSNGGNPLLYPERGSPMKAQDHRLFNDLGVANGRRPKQPDEIHKNTLGQTVRSFLSYECTGAVVKTAPVFFITQGSMLKSSPS